MRIIQGPISRGLLLVTVMLILYFIFVLNQLGILIYPFLLLMGAVILRVYVNRRLRRDEEISEEEGHATILHYGLALAGIGLGSILVKGLYRFPIENIPSPVPGVVVLSTFDAMLFGTLMALCEEQFFRGELLEWMATMMPPGLAIGACAFAFMAYHLQVYQTSVENLIYVLVGGVSLAWVTLRSRRLAPASLAHITNNIMVALSV